MPNYPVNLEKSGWILRAAVALSVVVCLNGTARAWGRPTILEPETQLSFRLVDPVRVETGQAQQAFLAVTQEDYESGRFERRGPRRVAVGYPAYPCGYYSPCYAYPGYYYPGYVGFYGGYYRRHGYRRW